MTMALIVTVDTEEEGLWGGRYPRTGNTVENIKGVDRFQRLCDRFNIRPTYLVDAPVVQDASAVSTLKAIQDDDRCEIGAHVHPWCNPPLNGPTDDRSSYLCNLPEQIQRDKVTWLTEQIEAQFGRRPTSFRAGRYGLDIVGARILHELGYVVDSSVIPFTNYSSEGGPNFEQAPIAPYDIDLESDNLLSSSNTTANTDTLLEVPVSVGYNRTDFRRAFSVQRFIRTSPLKHFRTEGILDRLGLLRRIKFSPEQADARRMKELVDASLVQDLQVMVMMLHSSSLVPSFSPYVQTEDQLDQFYSRLEGTFEYCLATQNMNNLTLGECDCLSRRDYISEETSCPA